MDTEFVRTLYRYTDWANGVLMDNAQILSEADYRRNFGQAWGSIHGTLAHLLATDSIWWARWHGDSTMTDVQGSQYQTLDAIREAWQPFMAARRSWIESLSGEDLTRKLDYKNTSGQAFTHPLWWLLVHVANHGTDHRSHISIMMTEMGHPPQPLDFIAYVRLKE